MLFSKKRKRVENIRFIYRNLIHWVPEESTEVKQKIDEIKGLLSLSK